MLLLDDKLESVRKEAYAVFAAVCLKDETMDSKVASYALPVTSYKLHVTRYTLHVTSYKLQATSYTWGPPLTAVADHL